MLYFSPCCFCCSSVPVLQPIVCFGLGWMHSEQIIFWQYVYSLCFFTCIHISLTILPHCFPYFLQVLCPCYCCCFCVLMFLMFCFFFVCVTISTIPAWLCDRLLCVCWIFVLFFVHCSLDIFQFLLLCCCAGLILLLRFCGLIFVRLGAPTCLPSPWYASILFVSFRSSL